MTDSFDVAAWRDRLEQSRDEKDEFLTADPRSPLPESARESFDGLDYFDPDPAYRVTATATVHDEPDPVEMTVTDGPPERFLHVVTFAFELPSGSGADEGVDGGEAVDDEGEDDGEAVDDEVGDEEEAESEGVGDSAESSDTVSETLAAYRREGDDGGLFVPFRDKTTGQATYRGGRYMDLHPEGELTDGDEVTVDFNLAYTPFCAFDDAFACPLPPEENWLSTTVPVGERDPDLDE
ncbi:DUF1684 domain-containing protein [Halobaculum sp. MBLA0147]|uniref:DUF1684 domain-containing protein n=1 Tax=Halobaculum sp. MBLA0147 TaxID=3079934 RepID=UPI003523339F